MIAMRMRFAMKNMPFDPTSMFERLVAGAPGGTGNDACCDWRADLGDGAVALVPTSLQIVPVLRSPDGRASRRSGNSAGCEAGSGPARLTHNLMATVMRCAMT
jgi:hypothetical protein